MHNSSCGKRDLFGEAYWKGWNELYLDYIYAMLATFWGIFLSGDFLRRLLFYRGLFKSV